LIDNLGEKELEQKYTELSKQEDFMNAKIIHSWIEVWKKTISIYPHNIAIIEVNGVSITYNDLDILSNQYSNLALKTKYKTIGVRISNSINFLACVIGLIKCNIIAVLFPDNEPVNNTIETAKNNGVNYIISDIKLPGITHTNYSEVSQYSQQSSASNIDHISLDSTAVVIFTSGTTGHRKGALFSHRRLVGAGICWSLYTKLKKQERCYICLPLYHGNGLAVAFSSCVQTGATAVIRNKFSASNLLTDLRNYNCSLMVYIGELWRILDKLPRKNNDSENPLKVIFGNGLTEELWKITIERFGITDIVEHYGATEMPDRALINWTNIPGYCGYIPPNHTQQTNIAFLSSEGTISSDENYGEILLRVPNNTYKGYFDPNSNADKVIIDKVTGILWWRSGDILKRNSRGYYSFIERKGENFRWKGENISVSEVESSIYKSELVRYAMVGSVNIPHYKEKGGVAYIQIKKKFNINLLIQELQKYLPSYSIPIFIRISKKTFPLTSTFKLKRQYITEQGWESSDYVLHNGQYITLSDVIKKGIIEGNELPNFRCVPSHPSKLLGKVAFCTRLWQGPRSIPDIKKWIDLVTISSAIRLVSMDDDANNTYGSYLKSNSVKTLHVRPWQSITFALNVLVHEAISSGAEYLFILSPDIIIRQENIIQMLSHMEDDTLVVGVKICLQHGLDPGLVRLSGQTSPWNTCAIWNLKKLGLTGFLSISDGLITGNKAGMEEVPVIALQQYLFPSQSKAKLISLKSLPHSFRDENYFSNSIHEKNIRAQKQLDLLGISSGSVIILSE
jgi:acyl-CoA synthetase (AMP-forming)/AMP-acid ligase II